MTAVRRCGVHFRAGFLILPGASNQQALVTVDRLRAIVAAQNWMAPSDGLNLTVSAGITDIRRDEAAEDLFTRADKALSRQRLRPKLRGRSIGGSTAAAIRKNWTLPRRPRRSAAKPLDFPLLSIS
jgi:hypothetical protein